MAWGWACQMTVHNHVIAGYIEIQQMRTQQSMAVGVSSLSHNLKFNFEIEFEIEEVGLLRAKSVGFS
jgi:ABC-type xylose transport system substrate-binding protein